jgi:hypothetical protein
MVLGVASACVPAAEEAETPGAAGRFDVSDHTAQIVRAGTLLERTVIVDPLLASRLTREQKLGLAIDAQIRPATPPFMKVGQHDNPLTLRLQEGTDFYAARETFVIEPANESHPTIHKLIGSAVVGGKGFFTHTIRTTVQGRILENTLEYEPTVTQESFAGTSIPEVLVTAIGERMGTVIWRDVATPPRDFVALARSLKGHSLARDADGGEGSYKRVGTWGAVESFNLHKKSEAINGHTADVWYVDYHADVDYVKDPEFEFKRLEFDLTAKWPNPSGPPEVVNNRLKSQHYISAPFARLPRDQMYEPRGEAGESYWWWKLKRQILGY